MHGVAASEITSVVAGFLRVYIIVGFLIVVMLLIWLVRKMELLEDEIYKNRSFFENHAMGDHHCSGDPAPERADPPPPERG